MTSSENSKSWVTHLPSALSVVRGVMGLIIPFLLLAKDPMIYVAAGILFFIAAITDFLDGWVARKFHCESDLGKILDPTMDKVLVLSPFAFFAVQGFYSIWWVVPIFIRELLITFFRIGWMLEGKAIGAEKIGKVKFCIQTVAISFAYFYFLSEHFEVIQFLNSFLEKGMDAFVILSCLITVVSGITFLRSNLALFDSAFFAKYVSAMGVGLLPGPAGTWGSLLTVAIYLLVFWNGWLFGGVLILCAVGGFWAISKLDLSQSKDPGFVVLDEAVGMLITYALVPISFKSVLIGFILFRFFDIAKPFPCRQLEKMPRFWGILMDDVGAGIYSCVFLYVIMGWLGS